jgi:hypothetical protein
MECRLTHRSIESADKVPASLVGMCAAQLNR